MSPLRVQHIYSVHAACLGLVLKDSSWIERLLTANTQKTGQNYIISEWDPSCVLSFSPLWDVQAYSPPATCAVESARNLSLSRATVLINISSAARPTHIYGIYRVSSVILSSSIIYFHLNRVCVLFVTTTNVTSPSKGSELKMNSQVKENSKKVCTAHGSPCSSNVRQHCLKI